LSRAVEFVRDLLLAALAAILLLRLLRGIPGIAACSKQIILLASVALASRLAMALGDVVRDRLEAFLKGGAPLNPRGGRGGRESARGGVVSGAGGKL